jgi:hypothetical protein
MNIVIKIRQVIIVISPRISKKDILLNPNTQLCRNLKLSHDHRCHDHVFDARNINELNLASSHTRHFRWNKVETVSVYEMNKLSASVCI